MKARPVLICAALALSLASPALAFGKDNLVDAAAQPLRDLSIIKRDTPQILKKAAEAPYAPAGDCEIMRQEIADLDQVLGEDLGEINDDDGTLITSVVRSAVKLPFNGVIRRITGAQRRDAAYEDALVAGVARRAFLKGALTACGVTPPLVPEKARAQTLAAIPLVPEPASTGESVVAVATAP